MVVTKVQQEIGAIEGGSGEVDYRETGWDLIIEEASNCSERVLLRMAFRTGEHG